MGPGLVCSFHLLKLQLREGQEKQRVLAARQGLAGLLGEIEGRGAGCDDAQPLNVVGQQLQVQADLPHVLGLVHDQRPPPADEGSQLGQGLAFQIFAHGDVFTGHHEGIPVVLPDVTPDQGGFPHPPGAVHHHDLAGSDQTFESDQLRLGDVGFICHTD